MGTHQVPEVLLDHELQRFSRASGIPSDQRGFGHDMADGCNVRVQALRRDLAYNEHSAGDMFAKHAPCKPNPWP